MLFACLLTGKGIKMETEKEKTPCHTNKGVIYFRIIFFLLYLPLYCFYCQIKWSKPVFFTKVKRIGY